MAMALEAQLTDDRARLMGAFNTTRRATCELSAPLSPEDQTVQSMLDASPTKWHLAHTSWFFETFLLKTFARDYDVFDDSYEVLFNSYYNAVGEQFPRDKRGLISRPTTQDVLAYREHVDAATRKLIETTTDNTFAKVAGLIKVGINHEQQHQELICTDIKHVLAQNPAFPAAYSAQNPMEDEGSPQLGWASFDGGVIETGVDWELADFAFDNEGPRHNEYYEPFKLADRLVTNGDYLAFMEDGGYASPMLWLSDGWARVQAEAWAAPLYWQKTDEGWMEFTLDGLRALNLHAPVTHVSYYEADAFAHWTGYRLPREGEWEAAARGQPIEGNFLSPGTAPHPVQVNGQSAPLRQLFGDVWEWTQSAYSPYPGYRAPAGAIGEYNGKFMSGQMVLRGGSCATPVDHVRASYRNFFYPQQRWQFTGIRLAAEA